MDFLFVEASDSLKPKLKSAVGFAGVAFVVGATLSIVALIVVILESGYAQPSPLCIVLVHVAYWPVMLAGWSTHDLFVSFWVIPVNALAWGLIGFVLAKVGQTLRQSN